jgi:predicted outer membrane repeat protein
MEKINSLIFLMMLLFNISYGQTYHNTDISSNETWLSADNPHIVSSISITNNATLTIDEDCELEVAGIMTVEDGSTLIINEGCQIMVSGLFYIVCNNANWLGFYFDIYGELEVNGDISDPVVFSPMNQQMGWGGIYFNGPTDNVSSINYAIFSEAKKWYTTDPVTCAWECPCSKDYQGAAIFADEYDNLTITHSQFIRNYACASGGAIYINECSDDFILENNIFSENISDKKGGAIAAFYATPIIQYNIIENNESENGGGGIMIAQPGGSGTGYNTIISFNEISSNQSNGNYVNSADPQGGGGICICDGFGVQMEGNLIKNNLVLKGNISCDGNGGGLFIEKDGGNILLKKNVFLNNYAYENGGGIYYDRNASNSVNANFINNLIYNNVAEYGGGIYLTGSNNVTANVFNNTISQNEAVVEGGGLYKDPSSSLDLYAVNDIIYFNTPADLDNTLCNALPISNFSYCDIGCGSLPSSGTAGSYYSFDDDPEFESSTTLLTGETLIPGVRVSWNNSECIDNGDNSVSIMTAYDLGGIPRIKNSIIDIGAYENDFGEPPITQISNPELLKNCKIFPNPANEFIVFISNVSLPDFKFTVFNLTGQGLIKGDIKNKTNKINISSLNPGVYFIEVFSNRKGIFKEKFIKQ